MLFIVLGIAHPEVFFIWVNKIPYFCCSGVLFCFVFVGVFFLGGGGVGKGEITMFCSGIS